MQKGELAINWIIVAALGVLALFVVGFIFQSQISDFAKRITGISDDVDAERKGESCKSVFGNRACYPSSCTEVQTQARNAGDSGAQYRFVPAPGGNWSDCPVSSNCCERTN